MLQWAASDNWTLIKFRIVSDLNLNNFYHV